MKPKKNLKRSVPPVNVWMDEISRAMDKNRELVAKMTPDQLRAQCRRNASGKIT